MSFGEGKVFALVDDSIVFGEQVGRLLKKMEFGGKFGYYPTVRSFLDNCEKGADLIISDLSMPVHDGLFLYNWMLSISFCGDFIMCSADAEKLTHACDLFPGLDVIIKPLCLNSFQEKIKSCLT